MAEDTPPTGHKPPPTRLPATTHPLHHTRQCTRQPATQHMHTAASQAPANAPTRHTSANPLHHIVDGGWEYDGNNFLSVFQEQHDPTNRTGNAGIAIVPQTQLLCQTQQIQTPFCPERRLHMPIQWPPPLSPRMHPSPLNVSLLGPLRPPRSIH